MAEIEEKELIDLEELEEKLDQLWYLPEVQEGSFSKKLTEEGYMEISKAFDTVSTVVVDAFAELNENLKSEINAIQNKLAHIEDLIKNNK